MPGQYQHNVGALFVCCQSDLCRSVSASVGPVTEGEQEVGGFPLAMLNAYTNIIQQQAKLSDHLPQGRPVSAWKGPSQKNLRGQQDEFIGIKFTDIHMSHPQLRPPIQRQIRTKTTYRAQEALARETNNV